MGKRGSLCSLAFKFRVADGSPMKSSASNTREVTRDREAATDLEPYLLLPFLVRGGDMEAEERDAAESGLAKEVPVGEDGGLPSGSDVIGEEGHVSPGGDDSVCQGEHGVVIKEGKLVRGEGRSIDGLESHAVVFKFQGSAVLFLHGAVLVLFGSGIHVGQVNLDAASLRGAGREGEMWPERAKAEVCRDGPPRAM